MQRVDQAAGRVEFETPTSKLVVTGFPPEAWTYKLGHRSAVDHLDEVVALLGKVTRVSVVTMAVVEKLKKLG